ncbi:hypothetical protein P378_10935 [Desulforamulus profundi]|uniref:Uncharacterized protein n=1 Tax=Desulforamulus profundi TaxID=1383067 RepID=A0A2C6MDZ2_9FIRM|nr:hypothetical protein [Desulforamulus profundi]PHJ38338.1 hypothetical protein P378_10935 [Desulforamulus profundi]
MAGNRKATQLAPELWKKIYEKNPEDPTAEAYYGSCLALEARNSTNTGNRPFLIPAWNCKKFCCLIFQTGKGPKSWAKISGIS